MVKKTILPFCLFIFLAASCVPASVPTEEEVTPQSAFFSSTPTQENSPDETDNRCIPPVATWEFAIELPRSITTLPIIPPPSEWKVQTSLPENDSHAYLILIENHQNYDVVWVHIGEKYFRYRTDTQQWGTASFENEAENDDPSWIFQDQNGKVWNLATSGQYLRFFRLNDNDQFELINGSEIHGSRNNYDIYQTSPVRKDNTFWFLAFDSPTTMSLFSFDPNTGKAKPYLTGEYDAAFNPPYPFGQSIAFGQDGSIFLMRLKDAVIVRYDPSTSTSNDIVSLGNFDNITLGLGPDLFVDRGGNLWINDYGWIDFRNLTIDGHPTLHQIIRSPLFITTGLNDRTTYQWVRPYPMLESSDGRIWFRGGAAGLVWLDSKKGQWCKFTTIDSNILEDKDGNLWLLYDSKLYKYTITP